MAKRKIEEKLEKLKLKAKEENYDPLIGDTPEPKEEELPKEEPIEELAGPEVQEPQEPQEEASTPTPKIKDEQPPTEESPELEAEEAAAPAEPLPESQFARARINVREGKKDNEISDLRALVDELKRQPAAASEPEQLPTTADDWPDPVLEPEAYTERTKKEIADSTKGTIEKLESQQREYQLDAAYNSWKSQQSTDAAADAEYKGAVEYLENQVLQRLFTQNPNLTDSEARATLRDTTISTLQQAQAMGYSGERMKVFFKEYAKNYGYMPKAVAVAEEVEDIRASTLTLGEKRELRNRVTTAVGTPTRKAASGTGGKKLTKAVYNEMSLRDRAQLDREDVKKMLQSGA